MGHFQVSMLNLHCVFISPLSSLPSISAYIVTIVMHCTSQNITYISYIVSSHACVVQLSRIARFAAKRSRTHISLFEAGGISSCLATEGDE